MFFQDEQSIHADTVAKGLTLTHLKGQCLLANATILSALALGNGNWIHKTKLNIALLNVSRVWNRAHKMKVMNIIMCNIAGEKTDSLLY